MLEDLRLEESQNVSADEGAELLGIMDDTTLLTPLSAPHIEMVGNP
jgi:hypothetical protein